MPGGRQRTIAGRTRDSHLRGARSTLTPAGSGPGGEPPGGGGRAARVGRSCFSHSGSRLGKGRQADRGCPSLSSWVGNTPVVAIPSLHTRTPTTPAKQARPLPSLPRSQGAESGRGFSTRQWGLETRNGGFGCVRAPLPGSVPASRSASDHLSVGAHRGQSYSFGPTRKVRSKREVWMLPRVRDKKIES